MRFQLFLAEYPWGRVALHTFCLLRKSCRQRKPGQISHWAGIIREMSLVVPWLCACALGFATSAISAPSDGPPAREGISEERRSSLYIGESLPCLTAGWRRC